jgi:hypothetical protein
VDLSVVPTTRLLLPVTNVPNTYISQLRSKASLSHTVRLEATQQKLNASKQTATLDFETCSSISTFPFHYVVSPSAQRTW